MAKQLKRFSESVSQTIEELSHIKQQTDDADYAKRLADGTVIELSAMVATFPKVLENLTEKDVDVKGALEQVTALMQKHRQEVAEVESTFLLGIKLDFIKKHLDKGSIPPLEMVFISSVVVVKMMELYLAAFLCHRDHRQALQVLDDGFQGPSLPEQDPKLLFLFMHRIVAELISDGLLNPAIPNVEK
jgi:hypothetical protein